MFVLTNVTIRPEASGRLGPAILVPEAREPSPQYGFGFGGTDSRTVRAVAMLGLASS